jgi:predicted DNA-binding transcriptional regulator AlpA
MPVSELPVLLTIEQVSEFTGLAKQTLDNWRSTKLAGPNYIKLGNREVRYRLTDVERWLERSTVKPAS